MDVKERIKLKYLTCHSRTGYLGRHVQPEIIIAKFPMDKP